MPVETDESSSEPSETTSEEPDNKSETQSSIKPSESTPREKTPTPELSVSSKSDSFCDVSERIATFRNYQSDSSASDIEEPPAFIEKDYEPI